jgi:hypothetical protein
MTRFLRFVNEPASRLEARCREKDSIPRKRWSRAFTPVKYEPKGSTPTKKTIFQQPLNQIPRLLFLFLVFLFLSIYCGRPELPEGVSFEILGVCPLPGYARDVDIMDDYAYIANDQGGLQIIDISNPESTFIVGSYVTEKEIQGVAVRDTFAYLAVGHSQGGINILNIRDPVNPTLVGKDETFYGYELVAPADDSMYVYIAARYWCIVEDVKTYPQWPSFVRRFSTSGDIRGIFFQDSLIYVACEQMGMHIFDLAEPIDSLAMIGWIDTPSNAQNIFVAGNYAYIADGRAGLVIIDVSDPKNPALLSVHDTPEYANDVFINNNYAYIADGEGGLQVIDITNPEEPALHGSLETTYAYSVYVENGLIYIADRDMGLIVAQEKEE